MIITILNNHHLTVVLCILVLRHYKVLIDLKLQAHNELMSCDKDFGYVKVTRGLTCGRYGDLRHDIQD